MSTEILSLSLIHIACAGKIAPGQYDELVEDALRFIRTGSEETLLALERRMEQAA